jgi:hypothetical protein
MVGKRIRQYQEFIVLLVIADGIIIEYCGGGVHGVAFMPPRLAELRSRSLGHQP